MKRADTAIPVHEFIAERWSPRSFDPTHVLDPEQALALMEAARWAPSANNLQPWRFAIAHRGTPQFDGFVATLNPGNNVWAPNASALILAAAVTKTPEGKDNHSARYDLGLAVSLLTVQAHAMGLHVHQMGGFDRANVASDLALADDIAPVVILAVGRVASPEQLDTPFLEREVSVRQRHPLSELVLFGLD
jgi:nitroreductase